MADLPVEIWELVHDEQERDTVLLRDERGRLLPIVIGPCEATAIYVCLKNGRASAYVRRPSSHDLIQNLIERLDAHLERVVIDGLVNETFYATLHLVTDDSEFVVDARPSDAIAVLLRMAAPLFVNAEVMEEAGINPDAPPGEEWGGLS
jgi:bifunctional DNase/RNase